MFNYEIFSLGDQAITLSFGNTISLENHKRVLAAKEWLQGKKFPGVLDIIVAYSSITILYDAFAVKKYSNAENVFQFVKEKLADAIKHSANEVKNTNKVIRIPVCYDEDFGIDLRYISELKNISVEEIIALHTAKTYHVYMIGFLPGFPYMAEVNEKLVVPRKEKPRTKIEPGSVGLAGVQTGIYPLASPGGWQIIGRTPLPLFNKDEDPPVKLEPGDQVQFYSITKEEFEKSKFRL